MKRSIKLYGIATALLSLIPFLNAFAQTTIRYAVAEPVTHGRLQIFPIEGTASAQNKRYMTLAEALQQKKVTVRETGTVNELAIDNNSDEYLFIQSGDIVKGGKQDRTIGYDVVLPPFAKNIPLKSFCVEQGRWQKRGNEDVKGFQSSPTMLPSKELRMAAKYEQNQGKVWENVSDQQKKLKSEISRQNGRETEVTDRASATSLQLTLESKDLEAAKKEYENALKDLLSRYPRAIGYAYAINGQIYGADVYNSRELFENLWGKLLDATIVEAIATAGNGNTASNVQVTNVEQFLNAAEDQSNSYQSKDVNKTTTLRTKEGKDKSILFETIDNETKSWIHKNYVKE